jgi:hypothetical protein
MTRFDTGQPEAIDCLAEWASESHEYREKVVAPFQGTPLSPYEAAQALRTNFKLADLERQIRSALERIAELEAALTPKADASRSQDAPRLMDVIAVTNEVFGTNPTIEIDEDPETAGDAFVVFSVTCAGSPSELVKRRLEWHNRVAKIPPGSSGRFRLTIYPTHESK